MADLRALKDKAAELAARGKLDKAAETLRDVLRADPSDLATRQRLAEVLRRAERVEEAIEAYAAAADGYARQGLLAKAIAVHKAVLELDPSRGASLASLAELYAARARVERPARLTAAVVAAAPTSPAPEPAPSVPRAPAADEHVALPLSPAPIVPEPPVSSAETPLAQIVSAARAAAAAGVEDDVVLDLDDEPLVILEPTSALPEEPVHRGAPVPSDVALPHVPLFSDLSREAFVALTEGLHLVRAGAGEPVIQEGDIGASFFVVASGTLAVTRRDDRGERVRLANLGEGDFFGEMAILTGAPRAATVTAETACELLELPAPALLDLARRHPHVATSLRRFYRRRLIANAMAMSPVFRPFSREDRQAVMGRFRSREVREGEVIVREGELSDGLYVVLDGALQVTRRGAGAPVQVAELREADVFGEMSCLRKAPAAATLTVRRAGTLLRLPRERFDELVLSHPQVLEAVAELSDERVENLDAIQSGRARWTEEGLVLV